MTKMEALKEVNETLTEVLDKIETHMFIENINISNDDVDTDNSLNAMFRNKMVE